MTISIPAKTKTAVVAYHYTQDEVPGYILQVGPAQLFIEEAAADKLARYMLFKGTPEDK